MVCDWCEGPLTTKRQRRFCSDNCRKRHHEDQRRATCPKCGKLMGVGSGYRDLELCATCHRAREAAAHRARVEDAAEMYREGRTHREIAQLLGYGPNSLPHEVDEAFKLGLLTEADYRRSAEDREAMRLGREAAKAA